MQTQILVEDRELARRPCPICGCQACRHLSKHSFVLPEGHPLESGYVVVTCNSCGFAYADTTANQAAHDEFYARLSKYEDHSTSTGGGATPWDEQRLRDAASTISQTISKNARILDMGCANGGLLVELRQLGHENLYGVDPSPLCVRHTMAKGIQATAGTLPGIAGIGTFDCIILSHVLEHIHDLAAALESVRGLLSANGVVYAEVPDASRYQDFLYSPFQDFNTEHINHFSPQCLRNLFSVHGFRPRSGGLKDIASSEDTLTPALFGVFEQSESSDRTFERDEALGQSLAIYVEQSRTMLAEIDSMLRLRLQTEQPVIVWGTGQLTMKLLSDTILREQPIAAFVDKNPINHGRVLRGTEILPPEEIFARRLQDPILIASLLHGRSIERDIRNAYSLDNSLLRLTPQ